MEDIKVLIDSEFTGSFKKFQKKFKAQYGKWIQTQSLGDCCLFTIKKSICNDDIPDDVFKLVSKIHGLIISRKSKKILFVPSLTDFKIDELQKMTNTGIFKPAMNKEYYSEIGTWYMLCVQNIYDNKYIDDDEYNILMSHENVIEFCANCLTMNLNEMDLNQHLIQRLLVANDKNMGLIRDIACSKLKYMLTYNPKDYIDVLKPYLLKLSYSKHRRGLLVKMYYEPESGVWRASTRYNLNLYRTTWGSHDFGELMREYISKNFETKKHFYDMLNIRKSYTFLLEYVSELFPEKTELNLHLISEKMLNEDFTVSEEINTIKEDEINEEDPYFMNILNENGRYTTFFFDTKKNMEIKEMINNSQSFDEVLENNKDNIENLTKIFSKNF